MSILEDKTGCDIKVLRRVECQVEGNEGFRIAVTLCLRGRPQMQCREE